VAALRILAADDYPANLRIVTRLLETRGHTVETVTTGTAAAAAILASQYDLVLMDCRMPEMDGWEATALVRAQERGRALETGGRRTPIIALTANDGEEDRQRCFAVGMDAFVAKPLKPEELFAAMAQVGVGGATGSAPGLTGRSRPGATPAGQGGPLPVTGTDLWIELVHALAGLTHDAELALTHVGPGGARNIRAVIRAAVRAREISQRLRPAAPEPSVP
jgi:CheY-like chemotaxis protein